MRAAYEDRRRSQMHYPPQQVRIDRYAQKRSFSDERSYYTSYSAPSDMSSKASWTCDDESEVSEPESDASSVEVAEPHIYPIKGHSLHVVVATLVIIFLFEIPLRLPYFLALFFAVPSLHVMFTPVPSTKFPHSHIEDLEDSDCHSVVSSEQEVLYRRSSDEASDSGSDSSASSPTPQAIPQATPQATLQTTPWFASFIPWTMNGRKNLFTDYSESHFKPRRTYREAFSDTIPRVAKSTFECAYSFLRLQLRFRAFLITVQNTCAFVTGREVDAEEHLDDIVRFYVDWIVGIGGLLWLVVRMMLEDAVRGLRDLGGLLWVWVVRYENGGVPIARRKARMTAARTPFRSMQQPLVSVIRRE